MHYPFIPSFDVAQTYHVIVQFIWKQGWQHTEKRSVSHNKSRPVK